MNWSRHLFFLIAPTVVIFSVAGGEIFDNPDKTLLLDSVRAGAHLGTICAVLSVGAEWTWKIGDFASAVIRKVQSERPAN